MKKAIFVIPLVLLCIFGVVISYITMPWGAIFGIGLVELNPPTPEITYGEFPYWIKYEIDGRTFIAEGKLICEYDGIGWNEGVGKHRKWKGTISGSDKSSVLLLEKDGVEIYCALGGADYYMGDKKTTEPYIPNLYLKTEGRSSGNMEEISKYNVSLVDWVLSEPIKNTFGYSQTVSNIIAVALLFVLALAIIGKFKKRVN